MNGIDRLAMIGPCKFREMFECSYVELSYMYGKKNKQLKNTVGTYMFLDLLNH